MAKPQSPENHVEARRDIAFLLATLIACAGLYYWFFVKAYLPGNIVLGGDTQVLWSLNYLAMLSLKAHGEFLWWDPTIVNGWPAYVNLTSGWFNYMSPFALPAIALFKLGTLFADIPINKFLVLQKTLYYFTLNLLAVLLISKEVIASRVARLLPALIFTLSAVQFHGFRDSVLYESMPAPLFLVWALVRHVNRNTAQSFILLLVFLALYIASLNYGALQTSLWWVGFFLFFLLLLHRDWVRSLVVHPAELWKGKRGRRTLLLASALGAIAATAFLLPVAFNLGELLRVLGSGPVDYFSGASGGFGAKQDLSPAHNPAAFNISHPIWSSLFYWIPFESIHDAFLPFDIKEGGVKAGVDHRYIGLATLPMLLAAVTLGARERWGLVFTLAAFACAVFVGYNDRNLLVVRLSELTDALKNIRTIADTLPRDGPIVFLAIASGIGFDKLLRAAPSDDIEQGRLAKLLVFLLACGCAVGFAAIAASVLPPSPTTGAQVLPGRISEAFAHIGIYLVVFCIGALLLVSIRHERTRMAIAAAVLVFAFMDLTISATGYWQRGLVWFRNAGPHTLPQAQKIAPIQSSIQNWPGAHAGFLHNPFGGPYVGLRAWLVLSSRPAWQGLLENWDPRSLMMKAYPDFRFFANPAYLPYSGIAALDSLAPPKPGDTVFFVHREVPRDGAAQRLDAAWRLLEYSPNRVRIEVSMPKDGYVMSLDNFDRFWSARIDERAAEILRANYTFKALGVPAGTHIVEWTYDPYPVKIAWGCFYLVLLLLAGHLAGLGVASSLAIAAALLLGAYSITGIVVPRARADALSGGALVCKDGRMELRSPEGKTYAVTAGFAGAVEGIFQEPGAATKIIGWAVDEVARQPPGRVVVTLGDKVWLETTRLDYRQDIAQLSPSYSSSGFSLIGRGAGAADAGQVRVFALLANGSARELGYWKDRKSPATKCAP